MKIVKREPEEMRFQDLNTGDVFEWNYNYYIVIEHTKGDYNAVNLIHGDLLQFSYDDYVTSVDCELVIK